MSEWKIRPYQASDESGVTFLWLNSWLCGPFGRRWGAMARDENGDMRQVPDRFRLLWNRYEPVVKRVIDRCPPTILCDPEAEDIIWAFVCDEPEAFVVHMAVIKRKFGIFADMMLAALGVNANETATRYTHECPDVPAAIRAGWTYEREMLVPLLARSGT